MELSTKMGTTMRMRKAQKLERVLLSPPDGFMTGDEFERRVKARVTKFYQDNGTSFTIGIP
ncbi:hypothetical protein AGMMS49965_23330 [Bacteroidia bacterium]|nr:hypothetical protein AGMMS49965_23330 [Bacteroidia bacterium]